MNHIQMGDSTRGYGAISVAVHWLVAAAVLGLLCLGLVFEDLSRGPDRLFLQNLHTSIGVSVVVLFLLRRLGGSPRGFRRATKGLPGNAGPPCSPTGC